ncbi:MAG TPA: efflux transporter periplasmic adaptor subunit, partial [Ramlibacter sp.]
MSQRHEALGIHPIGATDGEDGTPTEDLVRRRQVLRRARIAAVVVLVVLALGSARIVVTRMANARTLAAASAEHAVLYVRVASPQAAKAGQTLTLPGTL